MWRPFANLFVSHTYGNFARKQFKGGDPMKSKRRMGNSQKTFSMPRQFSKEETQDRMEQFSEIQKKVQQQRLMIKLKDKELEDKKKLRDTKYRLILQKRLEQKREFYKHLQSLATTSSSRTKSHSPANRSKTTMKKDTGTIFALTAADTLESSFDKKAKPQIKDFARLVRSGRLPSPQKH